MGAALTGAVLSWSVAIDPLSPGFNYLMDRQAILNRLVLYDDGDIARMQRF
jgi:hypothetical protein